MTIPPILLVLVSGPEDHYCLTALSRGPIFLPSESSCGLQQDLSQLLSSVRQLRTLKSPQHRKGDVTKGKHVHMFFDVWSCFPIFCNVIAQHWILGLCGFLVSESQNWTFFVWVWGSLAVCDHQSNDILTSSSGQTEINDQMDETRLHANRFLNSVGVFPASISVVVAWLVFQVCYNIWIIIMWFNVEQVLNFMQDKSDISGLISALYNV